MQDILIAIIPSILTLVGVIITNSVHNKNISAEAKAQSELFMYRVEQLERKVEKHNNLVERTYKLEELTAVQDEQIKVANHRIDDLERR